MAFIAASATAVLSCSSLAAGRFSPCTALATFSMAILSLPILLGREKAAREVFSASQFVGL